MEIPWILCNKCFAVWDETATNLHLTQCHHIFCTKCVSKLSEACPICNAVGVQTTPITSPLSPMIAPLFADMEKAMASLMIAAKFQESQAIILANHELRLEEKCYTLKTATCQVLEDIEIISQEFHKLREDYIQLNEFQAQTASNEISRNRHVNFSNQNISSGAQDESSNAFHSSRVDSEESDTPGSTINVERTPTIAEVLRSDHESSGSSGASGSMSD